jgi:hypothetical protein
LIAGLCNATADELLDLETRDLAEMKTVSGITVVFDPGRISMVYTLPRSSGSSSSRSGSITNILGLSSGPQEVSETADSLLDRLNLRQPAEADTPGHIRTSNQLQDTTILAL